MRRAFAEAIVELAARDSRVVFLTGDLGFGVFDEFRDRFGPRYINVGVAEAQMVNAAAGLAMEGYRPIAYSIASFATARPFEQLRFCVAYHGLPVTLVGAGRGFTYAASGVSHHASDDLALMSALPGMQTVAPGDPTEVSALLPQVVASGRPAYFTVGRYGEPTFESDAPIELGKMRCLREGRRVAIVAQGEVAHEALGAVDALTAAGYDPSIYNVHTIKPLDHEGLARLGETYDALIVVEEHVPLGGLWDAVARHHAERPLAASLVRLGAPDAFMIGNPSREEVRARIGVNSDAIVRAVRDACASPSQAVTELRPHG